MRFRYALNRLNIEVQPVEVLEPILRKIGTHATDDGN